MYICDLVKKLKKERNNFVRVLFLVVVTISHDNLSVTLRMMYMIFAYQFVVYLY